MPDELNSRLPILPHQFLGDADCCGCLGVIIRGDEADFVCNECEQVICTVPADGAEAAFQEFARQYCTTEVCSATCPHCGAVHTFPGFSSIDAFVCDACGARVVLTSKVQ